MIFYDIIVILTLNIIQLIDLNEVDIQIYLPEKLIIYGGR